jgi:cysteine desulfurase/selenocysteine lyase
MFKKDFPLIKNHPEILYLDNAASTQKPESVIE